MILATDFERLVEDQFVYGGQKYANSSSKEVTDILTEDYGFKGLLWCINKYVYRYKNQGREKDPLKVACYMFIIWLKFGFHNPGILSTIKRFLGIWVNTTVDVKSEYFPVFMSKLRNFSLVGHDNYSRNDLLNRLTKEIRGLRSPFGRTELRLIYIFKLVERVWEFDGFKSKDSHDTDTWNEAKNDG